MCLENVKLTKLDHLLTYKVFSIHDDRLMSAFRNAWQKNLYYRTDSINFYPRGYRVGLDGFYSFENKNDALRLAAINVRYWNCFENLIVLPVIIYNPIYSGVHINDLWNSIPAYMSNGIKIFDSSKLRELWKKKIDSYRLKMIEDFHYGFDKNHDKVIT